MLMWDIEFVYISGNIKLWSCKIVLSQESWLLNKYKKKYNKCLSLVVVVSFYWEVFRHFKWCESVDGIIFVDDCKCRWMSSVELTLLLCYLGKNFSLATRLPKISENYNGNICRVYILTSYIPTIIQCLKWNLSRMIFFGFKKSPEILKYWVGAQQGQSYLMGRRCLFSLGWPPF